ncbi:MAG: type II secretion system protein [Patescibacteria group bacterium]|nr:type II secretion system protein [Patescibacteria group bacterium]
MIKKVNKVHKVCKVHKVLTNSGFTLVEMLIALAVFMIVAVVAISALLKIIDANHKSQTLQDTVNNLNYSLDAMTREIRVGSEYDCPKGNGSFNQNNISPNSCDVSNDTSGSVVAFSSTNVDSSGPCNLIYAYGFAPRADITGTNAWTLVKAEQSGCGAPINPFNNTNNLGNSYSEIIDPSVVITSYRMIVNAGNSNPLSQPSVTLYISGYSGSADKTKTYFDLQTTISERV